MIISDIPEIFRLTAEERRAAWRTFKPRPAAETKPRSIYQPKGMSNADWAQYCHERDKIERAKRDARFRELRARKKPGGP